MNKVQKISTYLVWMFNILLIVVPISLITTWALITKNTPALLETIHGFSFSLDHTVKTNAGVIDLSTIHWTPTLKFLLLGAEILRELPLLLSLILLRSIFKNYKNAQVFTVKNAIFYRRLGIVFLFDALLIKSLSNSLIALIATIQNTPGHRYLSVSFDTDNIESLFYGVLAIVISWIMLEASKIHEEQNLTI